MASKACSRCLTCDNDLSRQFDTPRNYTNRNKLLCEFVYYVSTCDKCGSGCFSCNVCRLKINEMKDNGSSTKFISEHYASLFGGYDNSNYELCILRHIAAEHYGFGKSVYTNANIQHRLIKNVNVNSMVQLEYIARKNPYLILLKSSAEDHEYDELAEAIENIPYDSGILLFGYERKVDINNVPERYNCVQKFMEMQNYECAFCRWEFECLPTFEVFIAHIKTHPTAGILLSTGVGVAPSIAEILLEQRRSVGPY